MNERCAQHGGRMVEEKWAALLSDTQHKGLFWCAGGKHYVEVSKSGVMHTLRKVVGL